MSKNMLSDGTLFSFNLCFLYRSNSVSLNRPRIVSKADMVDPELCFIQSPKNQGITKKLF